MVEVDDFQPLECEHTVGPSYLLSADDRRQLEKRVRRQKLGGGLSIVGFYRSNTRKEFAVTAEDVDVMSAYFSKPSMIFLLVHAIPNGPLTGAFFIWKKCKVRALERHLELPLDNAALAAGSYQFCPNTSPPRSAARKNFAPGDSFPVLQLPRLQDVASRLHRLQKLSAIRTRAVNSRISRIRTDLGKLLTVHARASIAGVIERLQRLFVSEWVILTAMLAIGMVGGAAYQRSVRGAAVAAGPSVPAASGSNSPRSVDPSAPAESSAGAEALSEAARQFSGITTGAIPKPQFTSTKVAYRAEELSPTQEIPTPPRETTTVSDLLAPDPPEIAVPPVRDPDILSMESSIPTAAPARIPDPFVSVLVDPEPDGQREGLLRKFAHLHMRHTAASFAPPTLIYQAPLDVPSDLRHIQGGVLVDVRLYVDRAGAVEYADLLSNVTDVNRDLATLVVFSSRHWQFSPARKAGDTVPSEVVVHFKFGVETR